MKTILIPTDFSDTARNALNYALALFGADHRYILMNSFTEPSSGTSSMISLRDVLQEASEDSLAEEVDYLKTELNHPDLKLEAISVYGETASAISVTANKEEVDVIVMGTTGASGMKEVFIGSSAAGVLQKANCPVITVPKNHVYKAIKNVVFASDLKETEIVELPAVFTDLIKKSNAAITVVTVQKEAMPVGELEADEGYGLHTQLQDYQHDFKMIESEDVEAGIANYAHEIKADLIVTIPRKGSWFNRLFNPSVSKKLVQHIDMPLMALNTVK
jgi:nucleotide-binding universal stress UspA family protein